MIPIAHRFGNLNSHLNWFGDPNWGQTAIMVSLFLELGVKNIRTRFGTTSKIAEAYQPLFDAGVKICLVPLDAVTSLTGAALDTAKKTVLAELAAAKARGVQHLIGLEGVNEFHGPVADLRAFQQWFFNTVRADHAFDGLPVVAPPLGTMSYAAFDEEGSLDSMIDRGNVHDYTSGFPCSGSLLLNAKKDLQRQSTKPAWATEWGWKYAIPPRHPADKWFLPEHVIAKYLVRAFFDRLNVFERFFLYSLIDDPDKGLPEGKFFGLYDTLNQRKRDSFFAFKNAIAAVGDAVPVAPTVKFGAMPSTIRHQEFRCSDGTRLVELHNDVPSYDSAKFVELKVPPVKVTLTLPRASSKIQICEPTFNSAPKLTLSGSTVPLSIRDEVTLVRFAA